MSEILTLDQIAANNCGVEIQALLKKHGCVLVPRLQVLGVNPPQMYFDFQIRKVVEVPGDPKQN